MAGRTGAGTPGATAESANIAEFCADASAALRSSLLLAVFNFVLASANAPMACAYCGDAAALRERAPASDELAVEIADATRWRSPGSMVGAEGTGTGGGAGTGCCTAGW